MHTLNLFEPQATGVDPRGWTAHERVGYELGRDYARHQVDLPEPYARADSPLRQGLLSGARDFGPRRLAATRPVQRWLQLRLHAWLRGRSVELIQVTPNYLQQIDVSHCPITREPLSSDARMGTDACVDRVRNDAGYAAGNLAVISRRANHAKGSCGHAQSMDIVTRLRTRATAQHAGLSAVQWARVAVLASFVEPLTHAQACAVPCSSCRPTGSDCSIRRRRCRLSSVCSCCARAGVSDWPDSRRCCRMRPRRVISSAFSWRCCRG